MPTSRLNEQRVAWQLFWATPSLAKAGAAEQSLTAAAEAAAGEGTEVCSNPVRISETTADRRVYWETYNEAINVQHIGDVSSRAGSTAWLPETRAGREGCRPSSRREQGQRDP